MAKGLEEEITYNYVQEFMLKNINKIEMVHPIEYYQTAIESYQEDYYQMKSISMEISEIMNISSITKVENIVPRLLTFLVCWINQKGSVYYLYSFDENQKITLSYFCGQFGLLIPEKQILMKKMGGNIIENEVISVGDFNHDQINEIVLYSQYQNIGNAFCIHGFNPLENKMEEQGIIPIFINLEEIFPSVEYIGNGFRVLEVIDHKLLELAWNDYVWQENSMRWEKAIL
jgi:hypothetical protein